MVLESVHFQSTASWEEICKEVIRRMQSVLDAGNRIVDVSITAWPVPKPSGLVLITFEKQDTKKGEASTPRFQARHEMFAQNPRSEWAKDVFDRAISFASNLGRDDALIAITPVATMARRTGILGNDLVVVWYTRPA